MISSSQISLFRDSSRQVSAFDSTQLRINRQASAPQSNGNAVGSELTLIRQAAYRYSSQEQLAFSGSSTVTSGEGQQSVFTSAQLAEKKSRTYEYSELVQIQERPLTDPLVINFGAATARLTDTLFEFDLNGNGKVDDGTELFGPRSGSGFGELARFDDDGNRWIDANDEIFKSLSVWVQTADGSEALRSLEEVGVQALYVDNVEDRFTLANSQGVPLGQIKGSGIYLTTDGEVRTLEEIDLAEQNTADAPAAETVLSSDGGSPDRGGNGLIEARVEAIRSALEKLNEIREKQKAFIEDSRESGKPESPIVDYLKLIDKMRLEMLNSQDEKKQAASRYLEFASL